MAALAVVLQDWQNVAIKGRRRSGLDARSAKNTANCEEDRDA